jgi:hypothetical protein
MDYCSARSVDKCTITPVNFSPFSVSAWSCVFDSHSLFHHCQSQNANAIHSRIHFILPKPSVWHASEPHNHSQAGYAHLSLVQNIP